MWPLKIRKQNTNEIINFNPYIFVVWKDGVKMKSKDYQKGYLRGQLDEAEITYKNIVSIMDDMIEDPTKFTLEWISELEKFLKKHGRL
ncbi:hypothetical protein FO497_20545 [Bacillus cereus ATCC 10876]|uniref:hypothetical protein n=1 Tax=Bacillus TaxID=1386 RepID=UPI00019FF15A|nr:MULTISPECIES: hypothetical protein [Bacillus]MDJ0283925.1 hypothetical protein [Bacillus bombysepticus]EEK47351.1 hypothetical protein bcere0002_56570 [Bacillus cereus ATCC 10876]EKS7854355.1 hypothetical protein [Bacillus cereus]KFL75049.1 hypothetical protein DJ50_900 [Bacillus cereus ATCC 10876]MBG9864484.1 hypothetical protein [Bacillus cereus]